MKSYAPFKNREEIERQKICSAWKNQLAKQTRLSKIRVYCLSIPSSAKYVHIIIIHNYPSNGFEICNLATCHRLRANYLRQRQLASVEDFDGVRHSMPARPRELRTLPHFIFRHDIYSYVHVCGQQKT